MNEANKKITAFPESYAAAVDYMTDITGKLNSVTKHLNLLTEPTHEAYLGGVISDVQSQITSLSSINNYLPASAQLYRVI